MFNQQIWVGLTDTDRLVRYYTLLAEKMRRYHFLLNFLSILFTSGVVLALTTQLPDELALLLPVVIAVLTTWSHFADYGSKATAANMIAEQYSILAIEWRSLWYGGGESQERIDGLFKEFRQITSGHMLGEDKKLHQRAQREAYEFLENDFGASREERATTTSP